MTEINDLYIFHFNPCFKINIENFIFITIYLKIYVHRDFTLNKLNTNKVEPLTSIAETTLRLRGDEIKSKNIRDEILKNSPNENKDFFVVPKVVE